MRERLEQTANVILIVGGLLAIVVYLALLGSGRPPNGTFEVAIAMVSAILGGVVTWFLTGVEARRQAARGALVLHDQTVWPIQSLTKATRSFALYMLAQDHRRPNAVQLFADQPDNTYDDVLFKIHQVKDIRASRPILFDNTIALWLEPKDAAAFIAARERFADAIAVFDQQLSAYQEEVVNALDVLHIGVMSCTFALEKLKTMREVAARVAGLPIKDDRMAEIERAILQTTLADPLKKPTITIEAVREAFSRHGTT